MYFKSPERSKRIDNHAIKFTAIRIYIPATVTLRFNVNALPGFMCLIWLNALNFGFMLSTDISKIEYVHKIWLCNEKRKSRCMLMLYWHMRRYTGMLAGFIFLGCLFM